MNGIVPRVLWSKQHPPDDRGRIQMVSRVILFKDTKQGRLWLIEAGLGDGWGEIQMDIYGIKKVDGGLVPQLVNLGIDPKDITDVILTHLHFDHCAGVVTHEEGPIRLSFPKAKIYIQKKQLQWSLSHTLRDSGSYREDDIKYLASSNNLVVVEGALNLSESVSVNPLYGHTEAMQTVTVRYEEKIYIVAADLIPLSSHIRLPWIMAYDNQPLLTICEKREFLNSAAREEWIIVSVHDPRYPTVKISEINNNRYDYIEFDLWL